MQENDNDRQSSLICSLSRMSQARNPQPVLSIIVPLYNEAECVRVLYERIRRICESLGRSYEIILVDDGSHDGTYHILRIISEFDTHVRVIRFRKNYGQTAAMSAGFALALGEIIVGMDGDLQNDPADIPLLLSKLMEGFDVVCGWRKKREDKF